MTNLSVTNFVPQLAESCHSLAGLRARFPAWGPEVEFFATCPSWVLKQIILTLATFLHQIQVPHSKRNFHVKKYFRTCEQLNLQLFRFFPRNPTQIIEGIRSRSQKLILRCGSVALFRESVWPFVWNNWLTLFKRDRIRGKITVITSEQLLKPLQF